MSPQAKDANPASGQAQSDSPAVRQSESEPPSSVRRPPAAMVAALVILVLAYAKVLYDVSVFALNSTIYSHLLLIPFLVGWMLYTTIKDWSFNPRPRLWLAAAPACGAVLLLAGYWLAPRFGWHLTIEDSLAFLMLSFVLFLFAVAGAFIRPALLRRIAFPLAILLFWAPFPTQVMDGLEAFLQHRSADVAHAFFAVSGTTFLREDTLFKLPGISINVAPECSGVRSTIALFITSMVAGYLLLRSPWRRTALAAFVVPLALLRNAFRIFTISQLCIHIGPEMIHHWIHKKGGPIFFALSLIPFLALLWWLKKTEPPQSAATGGTPAQREEKIL